MIFLVDLNKLWGLKKLFFICSIFVLCLFGCNYNSSTISTFEFNYGPPLEYIDTRINQEVYNSELDSLLEYVYTLKNGKRDSLIYEWHSNRKEKNNINISVLKIKNGLYYHDDTLYSGNVFHSNYNPLNDSTIDYCCDTCSSLDIFIEKDFIVRSGVKLK